MTIPDTNDPAPTPPPTSGTPRNDSDRPRRDHGLWLGAGVALVLIILAGYGLYRFMTDERPAPPATQVLVPDLVGRREADAVALLSRAGLTVGTRTEVADPVVAAGSIASQQPSAGTTAPSRAPVSYAVSVGPVATPSAGPLPSGSPVSSATTGPTGTAPPTGGGGVIGDYRCLTLAAATDRLQADGYSVGNVTYTFSGGPVDASWLVETQAPPPGERRPAGTAVDLTLSSPFSVCPGG